MIVQMVYDLDVRVRRKAEALVAAGYSVDVLSLRDRGGKKSYSLNGVNVRTISLGKRRGSLARYLFEYLAFLIWATAQLSFRMPGRRYAIVDVNTLPDFLIFAGVLAKRMGAIMVLDMHEITPEFYMSKYGISEDSRLIRLLKLIEKISFRYADQVITITRPIEDLLVDRGLDRSKSTIVMNAADPRRFAEAITTGTDRNVARRDKFVMMYHGTLTPIYGLDLAVEAFALVHAEMPGAEFWILGSGTEEANLKGLIAARGLTDKVKLIGTVPGSEIPNWLSQSDVGVLPIRRDVFLEFAFPNKLPELILMGRSVIISRLKTIRHYFSDDALAYFEPNDPADLSRQMLRLYRNPELRRQLAERAREENAPICWEVMKGRYIGLMNRLTGGTNDQGADAEAATPATALDR